MTVETAFAQGWRQGSVLSGELSAVTWVRDPDSGLLLERRVSGNLWIVVTQDCNLYRSKVNSNSPTIELRQVLVEQPPDNWGIRARKFLVSDTDGHYLIDDKPSVFVSPRALTDEKLLSRHYVLGPDRVLALKIWLGNRYSRPAVPDDLVPLAKAIAQAVQAKERRHFGRVVREVLMEFDISSDARTFTLVAIVTDDADRELVREWLVEAMLEVPADFGSPTMIEARTAAEVSFAFVEAAYPADLSQLSWGDDGGLVGAV